MKKFNLLSKLATLSLASIVAVFSSCSQAPEIVVQSMTMDIPAGQTTFIEELMPNEVIDTKITHIAFVGPATKTLNFSNDSTNMLIFMKGNGTLKADTTLYELVPESIAIPITYSSVEIDVPAGETLHFVQFTKKITEDDRISIADFPEENRYDLYYTKFIDCEPYVEPIKSPNTVSRTVLPGDIIPRIALGTVGAPGPDEVGAHVHPMLDQLFLGLEDNHITVHADGASAVLPEFALLHIPLGSNHGVTVDANNEMYYLWMDFFMEREGQEWLKTHQEIEDEEEKAE
ncbi:MAG: hypothetical protein R3Y15_05910 [Rikenellaceae bacterium]